MLETMIWLCDIRYLEAISGDLNEASSKYGCRHGTIFYLKDTEPALPGYHHMGWVMMWWSAKLKAELVPGQAGVGWLIVMGATHLSQGYWCLARLSGGSASEFVWLGTGVVWEEIICNKNKGPLNSNV